MPKPDDKPTTPRSLAQATAAAAKAMRAFQKTLPPETVKTMTEIGQQIQADEPAPAIPAATVTAASDPVLEPVPAASAPDSAPEPVPTTPVQQPRRRRADRPQFDRVMRVLPRIFPPDGKVPWGMKETSVVKVVSDWVKDEQRRGKAPESEHGLPGWVSRGVVRDAVEIIGRAPKPSM